MYIFTTQSIMVDDLYHYIRYSHFISTYNTWAALQFTCVSDMSMYWSLGCILNKSYRCINVKLFNFFFASDSSTLTSWMDIAWTINQRFTWTMDFMDSQLNYSLLLYSLIFSIVNFVQTIRKTKLLPFSRNLFLLTKTNLMSRPISGFHSIRCSILYSVRIFLCSLF